MKVRAFACVVFGACPVFAEAPKFAPVTVPGHIYDGGWEHFVGGGVAVFDCNGDGLPDVFAAGGENPSQLFINGSSQAGPVLLRAKTPDNLSLKAVTGAYPLDIDGDGNLDLVVLRVGENAVLKGRGDCTFARFEGLSFVNDQRWTTAFSATWETGQALPTLAFGNYVDRSNPDGPFGACDSNILYRPKGVTYGVGLRLDPGFCPLSMLFSDWSRNGTPDLRISNDRHYYVEGGEEQMWSLSGTPKLYSDLDGWQSHQLWGMGIASRDIDGDGVPEVMMTSMGDQRLQKRDLQHDGPFYKDVPYDVGATAHRPYTGGDGRPSTGWHVAFGDMQNDGLDDIFIAKGNVEQMPGLAMKDPNNLLIQDASGKFEEAGKGAGLDSLHRGRGAALVDLNGDGLLDVVVVNRRAPMEVYQNLTKLSGNWIAVQASQSEGNVNAIGAWIEVKTATRTHSRELTVGGGHAGGHIGAEHFGLGSADTVKTRIIWPDQVASDWITLNTNATYQLTRKSNGGLAKQ